MCLLSKLFHDVGILSAANSDLLVFLERLVATLMLENYEGKQARIGITIVVVFVSINLFILIFVIK